MKDALKDTGRGFASMGEPAITKELQAAIVTVRANTAKWNEFDLIRNELIRLAVDNADLRTALDLRVDLIERLKEEIVRLQRANGKRSLLRRFIDWMNEPLP